MAIKKFKGDEITFEVMEHIGVISESRVGWKKEVNIVSWNGGPAKIDIREWDPDHERMTRGITLFEATAETLAKHLASYKPCEHKEVVESYVPKSNNSEEVTFDIIEHIGVLEERNDGWKKECNLVSWNGMTPKIDIRDWDPDHQRMGRGLMLTIEEADMLQSLLSMKYVKSA